MSSPDENRTVQSAGHAPEGIGRVEELLREEKVVRLCGGSPVTVSADSSVADVVHLLQRSDSKGAVLIVGADGSVAGIFTERDYLDKVAKSQVDTSGVKVGDLMTESPKTLSSDDTVDQAIRWMTQGGYRHLPVTNGDGGLVGLLSTRDIVADLADHFPVDVLNLPPQGVEPRSMPLDGG